MNPRTRISSLTYEPKSRFILIILHEIHVRFRRPRVGFCRSRSLHSIDRSTSSSSSSVFRRRRQSEKHPVSERGHDKKWNIKRRREQNK